MLKIISFIGLMLVVLVIFCSCGQKEEPVPLLDFIGNELDILNPYLLTFDVPDEAPTEKIYFKLSANGKRVGLYSDINAWEKYVNFGYFNFDEGLSVEIEIEPLFPFETVKVLPESLGASPKISEGKVYVTIDKPNTDLTFVFDEDYKGNTLHVFTNPIDRNEPSESSENLLYIPAGYHPAEEFGGQLSVTDGMTVYIAGGAVLNCPIDTYNAKNITIKGCGVVMKTEINSANPQYGNIVLCVNSSENVHISGIISNARMTHWSTHVYYSNNVVFENYRVISPRYASTDAMDISNSQNVTVKDCFLRACDDTISIKGLGGPTPADAPANENIHISDTVLWSDANNAMVVGEESCAVYYDNISFKNIDVLHSYDDLNHHEKLNERSAISMVSLHGTYFTNILWEDIRINKCQRLLCFNILDSFWFGTIAGDQSFPGGINGVILRNISCDSVVDSSIGNKMIINGYDESKIFDNIKFENFMINGRKIMSLDDPCFELVNNIGTVTFE